MSDKPLLDQQVEAGLRGDFARGWEIAQELARLSPACNRAAFNRAWYEMMHGDLLKGLELLDRGRWERAFGDQRLPTDKPIYRNEDLRRKHVLMVSEGGLGDEIINIRFAKDFADKGAQVIVTCDPSLKSIFSRVPGVAAVVGHKTAPDVYHDFWVPGMSAGHVLQYTYKKLTGEKYLFSNPLVVKKWNEQYFSKFPKAQRPRIGLRFFGNPKFEHEQHRKFPIEGLVAAVGNRPWVSLQKETSDINLATWEDTLAVLDSLDLIITSCTSVAHAAAALGKETWVITPILPYYVWALPGEKSPWYKSVRLFRQSQFGDWQNVFDEVALALNKRFPST